jgi:dTDP-4-amino-4,6-dideoxygalactose transaminase
VAARASAILADGSDQSVPAIRSKAFATWIKWLLTRPLVFGITAYPALRLRLASGKPLLDSAIGNELLETYAKSNPGVVRMANLQGEIGLRQLRHIDAFNEGARQNAAILSAALGEVPGIRLPPSGPHHIYVYYPLGVDPGQRDDLRGYLLRHGVDTKITDMSDCSQLDAFRETGHGGPDRGLAREASLLEICVYPVISKKQMHRIAEAVKAWASAPLP